MMGPDTVNIFVVRVAECEVEALRRMRDFVVESFRRGVLALPNDATLETIQVPALFGVAIRTLTDSMEITCTKSPDLEEPAAEEVEEETSTTPVESGAEEKRIIVQRLKNYRAAHGLGCFAEVARATRSRGAITEDLLRNIASDLAPKMELSYWRKIGKALDKLEQKEGVDG